MDKWTFIDLLQPACLCCGLASGGPGLLCPGCLAGLPVLHRPCSRCGLPLPPAEPGALPCAQCRRQDSPVARTIAPFSYAAPVDRLVQRLKFGGRLPVARTLGDLVAGHVERSCRFDRLPRALVPVPLHRSRQRQRGFNQAERIASAIGARLGIAVADDAVVRWHATAAQSGLALAARRANLRDAFAACRPLPAHVAIVDDVITTGSTVLALADTLRAAGVARIDVWAVCRTLPSREECHAQA